MKRVQRRRTKGWRMPEGTVYVGRPSPWGNPWRVGGENPNPYREPEDEFVDAKMAKDYYGWSLSISPGADRWVDPLRDATALACWCPLDQPCHADFLIDLIEGRA